MTPAQRYAFGLRAWRANLNYEKRRQLFDAGRRSSEPFRFGAVAEANRARLRRRGGGGRRA